MTDEREPDEVEEVTVLYLPKDCVLCGGILTRPWNPGDARRCSKCGARIRQVLP